MVVAHGKPTGQEQRKHIVAGKGVLDTRPKVQSQGHERSVQSKHFRACGIRPNHWARAKERGCHQPSRSVARPRLNHGTEQASGRCHRHGGEHIHPPNRRVPQRKRSEESGQECEKRIARGMGNPAGERGRRKFTAVAARHRGSQSRDVEHHQNQESQPGSEANPPSRLVGKGRHPGIDVGAFGGDAPALFRCRPAFCHGHVRKE